MTIEDVAYHLNKQILLALKYTAKEENDVEKLTEQAEKGAGSKDHPWHSSFRIFYTVWVSPDPSPLPSSGSSGSSG